MDPVDPFADPDAAAQAADALRAALSAFRPRLRQMSPRDRQRFNADVAARMRRLTRRASAAGHTNPYAAIRVASPARDANSRSLGQKIMAARNANLRK